MDKKKKLAIKITIFFLVAAAEKELHAKQDHRGGQNTVVGEHEQVSFFVFCIAGLFYHRNRIL